MNRLQGGFLLDPKKTRDFNEEILKLCESYGEPFKNHIQDLKLIIQKYGVFSNQVQEWLYDCPKFLRSQQFVGTACSLVGYQLYIVDAIEDASKFVNELLEIYPDTALAYVTQVLICCKKGKFKQSLETIRSAKYFYEKQENRLEELEYFAQLEKVIHSLTQQNKFWNRFRHNLAYTVAVISRFLIGI
ncbi:hypothetical protein [Nostoc sp.]|uniref:hypothetical protein n=1 Tax=Nostoc sp. TaxID=1180 RepID=UPI002FFA9A64